MSLNCELTFLYLLWKIIQTNSFGIGVDIKFTLSATFSSPKCFLHYMHKSLTMEIDFEVLEIFEMKRKAV